MRGTPTARKKIRRIYRTEDQIKTNLRVSGTEIYQREVSQIAGTVDQ